MEAVVEETRLFIGNLSYRTTNEDLFNCFQKFGKVLDHVIIKERDTGRSRGYGFVSFESREDADAAIRDMDGSDLDGRRIRVNIAQGRPREGGPRRPREDGYRGRDRFDERGAGRFADREPRGGRFEDRGDGNRYGDRGGRGGYDRDAGRFNGNRDRYGSRGGRDGRFDEEQDKEHFSRDREEAGRERVDRRDREASEEEFNRE